MRRIVWSLEARQDYRKILTYSAEHNVEAAEKLADLFLRSIENLAERPSGRPGRVKGCYEKSLLKAPYVIAYSLGEAPDGMSVLNILHIIHTRRNWRQGEWPKD